MTASLIDAPAPRKGLLAVIEPHPLDPALLARIPANCGSVSVYNFDAALMYDTIAQAMAAGKSSDRLFHQISGIASLVLGRNLRREILAPLGTQWVVYSDSVSNDLVLLNHPASAHSAADALESATFGLVNIANAQLPAATTQPINVDQRRLHGVDLTGMATGPLSPTFALRDKILYFGLSSDAVVTAATRVSCDLGQDVMHSAGFAAASKLLDSVDSTAFDYCDIPATAPAAYAGFPAAGAQLRLMLASFDITLPPIQLPPLAQLQPHLSPLFEATWADSNGVYSRSISPFPGSGLLLASPQQLTLEIATVSTAASLLQSAGNMMRQHAPRANKPGGDIWTSAALHDLIPQAGRWALLRSLAEKQPPDSF